MHKFLKFLVIVMFSGNLWGASDLTLFGAWTRTGPARTETGRIDLENFSAYGMRFEKYYAIFGLENSLAYQTQPILAKGGSGDGGIYYTANLVINLPVRGTVPFFAVGVGAAHKFGSAEPDIGTRFLTNYGFGVKFRRLAGPLGLRADFRRFNVRRVLDDRVASSEFSAGLMFSF